MMYSPFNTLDIPEQMRTYTVVVTGFAWALAPFLFVSQVIAEQTKIIKDERPEFAKVIVNTVIVAFTTYFLYRWIFMKIVVICEAIAIGIFNENDWSEFVKNIASSPSGQLSLTNLNVTTALTAFFSAAIEIIETVFLKVRYILLCLLYVTGPLFFVFGINGSTRSFMKNWFVNLIQVSFWVVVFKIMQGTLMIVNISSGDPSIADPLINGVIIVACSIMVPSITAAFLSSANLGLVGSAVTAAATGIAMKYGGGTALKQKAIAGAGGIKNKASQWIGSKLKRGGKGGAPATEEKTR